MFNLSTIEDTIRIPPQELSLPLLDAIKAQIEKLFFDKVRNFETLAPLLPCFPVVPNIMSLSACQTGCNGEQGSLVCSAEAHDPVGSGDDSGKKCFNLLVYGFISTHSQIFIAFNFLIYQVIKDLGLVVTLYDVKSVEGGFVFPGDGAPTYKVT